MQKRVSFTYPVCYEILLSQISFDKTYHCETLKLFVALVKQRILLLKPLVL